ncbi:MAG: hypothetical protein DCF17_14590 [Shackletoniella antarctica]|jgi:hemerythrin|uniref:Uncharacterized protein n=1 Tax=Shackletoniella antarctica TaxID=268115 RepID=A0A2W4W997_9CYAN|nr:MAG: hypothetical protein DCF17_14590 [Shackletoniella antarctica]
MANLLSLAWLFLLSLSIVFIFFSGSWALFTFILSCVFLAVWSSTPEAKAIIAKQAAETKSTGLKDIEASEKSENDFQQFSKDPINTKVTKIASISADTKAKILSKARSDWPNDFGMQKHTFDNQVKAYLELKNLHSSLESSEIVDQIFSSALSNWENDYEMQIHKVKSQFEAALKLTNYKNQNIPEETLTQIRHKAFRDWPDDYEMQLHTLKEQVAAWLSLNN